MCAAVTCLEGEFREMTPHIDVKKSSKDVDDSSDMYDDDGLWLKHVPNNNGELASGEFPILAFTLPPASLISSALKAASPQAP